MTFVSSKYEVSGNIADMSVSDVLKGDCELSVFVFDSNMDRKLIAPRNELIK